MNEENRGDFSTEKTNSRRKDRHNRQPGRKEEKLEKKAYDGKCRVGSLGKESWKSISLLRGEALVRILGKRHQGRYGCLGKKVRRRAD